MRINSNRALETTALIGTIFQLANGSIQGCNLDAEEILGYTAEQLREVAYFDPPWRTIHQDGANFPPETHPGINSIRTGKAYADIIMGFYQANGDLVWLSVDSQPLFQADTQPYGAIITFREITNQSEITQNNQGCQQTEERLKLATAAAGLGMWFWDLTSDRLEWTEQCNRLFGLDENTEISYQLFLNTLHPDDRGRTDEAVKQALANHTEYSIEYRVIWSDGSIHWIAAKGKGFYNPDGEPVRMMGTLHDISDRKQAEAELLKTDSILQSVINDTSSIIFVKDLQGKYIIANQAAADFIGIKLEEMLDVDDAALFPPEVARSIMTVDRQVSVEGISWSYEEEISNGETWRSLLTNKYPWRDHQGNILGVIGICRDITTLKQSEQKLKEQEQLLRLALRSANAGSWDWEIDTGKIVWSPENYDLYGLDPQKGAPQYQDWSSKLHPEDRDWINREVQKVVTKELPRFNHEFRIVHPQRGVRWLLGIGNVTLDDDGKPIRLSGINIDITERKLIEEKLRRSEQHLRRVLDSLYSFVGVLTPDGVLIEANRTALEAANLQPEDVIGKPFAEAYWWSYSPEVQAQLNDAIQRATTGERVRYEVEVRLGTENLITIDFTLIPLLDNNGRVEYLIPSGIDITQRKQAEKALRRSENQLRKVLDTLPVYVGLLKPDGRVININQTALAGVGIQLEDVLDRPFAETPWWDFDSNIQAQISDAIKKSAAGEAICVDIWGKGRGKDNHILVEFNMIPIFNEEGQVEYIVPSGIDITEREASKQALQASEYKLRLITEVIPQQVWTALPDGKIDYINQRWQEYTGVTVEEITEDGWSTIVHPDDLERVSKTWNKAVETGGKYNIKARLRQADGMYRWFLGRARPLYNEQGEIIKWYGTNTDITRIKQLEEKLRQQTKDLTKANQIKDEFLAIVSHELRTPLNPILGWSQLLAGGKLDAQKTSMGIEIIQRNAKLQAQLIDDLLDVSRILRGKLNLKPIPLNLESVIKSALATVQMAAEAKSINIETQFEPNIGRVSGDAGRLQQIVWNLVSNAIKFTPEGGRVTIKLSSVIGRSLLAKNNVPSTNDNGQRTKNQFAQIQVIDTGQGIDPEFLPYVFDRFRQAESSTTRKFGGLGLGLAIVRHLTELHGGTVAVTSLGQGQGATFSIRLPFMNTPASNTSDTNPVKAAVTPDRCNNIRVLVVDDEIDSRDILTFVLEQEGAEVTPVVSAGEALAAFEDSNFDLIISDIGMPQVDGYTLIRQIRKLPQGKDTPAIALTAYAGEINQQLSLDAGYQKHIAKPINIPELIDIIMQLISG